mmetsp:Transcript_30886/g.35281  ORF Transcript_30886/g.35281 Transcript_30886/m.35281 type:complete len:250 (-) Transcript_30886:15-764(-)
MLNIESGQREDVHCAFVRRAPQPFRFYVDSYAINFSFVRAPPELLDGLAGGGVEEPDDRALVAGRREQRALEVQRDAGYRRVVRLDGVRLLRLLVVVDVHADAALALFEAGEEGLLGRVAHRTQALGVLDRLDRVDQLEVAEVVHVNPGFEHDNDLVLAQPDGLDLVFEGELADALLLVVVPEHDLVHRILGVVATADQRQDVAPEQHLHNPDSSIEVTIESVFIRISVEYFEAVFRSTSEASCILVES